MLCSARELELGDDHSGIIDLPADAHDRRAGGRGARPRRSGDRDQGDAQPRRLPGRARHRARPRGGRPRHAEAARRPSKIAGQLQEPDQVDARLRGQARQPLPDRRRPPFPRRQERPVARLAAAPAEGDRPAADLDPGRHHQPRDLRPQPAAARVRRRRSSRAISSCARRATARQILALDGKTYTLDPAISVIADDSGVHGIGGIMGGEDTGVHARTPPRCSSRSPTSTRSRIAATGRKLGIQSDARYRFERGIDPQSCRWGAEVATRLILELCGGEASEIASQRRRCRTGSAASRCAPTA